jgi:endonuclease YncB( thermonuclease family)
MPHIIHLTAVLAFCAGLIALGQEQKSVPRQPLAHTPLRLTIKRTPPEAVVGPFRFLAIENLFIRVAPLDPGSRLANEVMGVHLAGIYCPYLPLASVGHPENDTPLQRELNQTIQAFVERHLKSSTNLSLRFVRLRAAAGAVDGVLYLDEDAKTSLQELMITAGLARVDRDAARTEWALPSELVDRWVSLDQQAREARRGFWGSHPSAMGRRWDTPRSADAPPNAASPHR